MSKQSNKQPKQKNVFPAALLRKLIDELPTFEYEYVESIQNVFTKKGLVVRVFDPITPEDYKEKRVSSVFIGPHPVLGVAQDNANCDMLKDFLRSFNDKACDAYLNAENSRILESVQAHNLNEAKEQRIVIALENLYIKAKRKPARHNALMSTKLFDTVFKFMQANVDTVSKDDYAFGNKVGMVLIDKNDTVLYLKVDIFDFEKSEMILNGVDCRYMYDNKWGDYTDAVDYSERLIAVYEFIKMKSENESPGIDPDYLRHLANRFGVVINETEESK